MYPITSFRRWAARVTSLGVLDGFGEGLFAEDVAAGVEGGERVGGVRLG